jgi:hypothetical protein
MAGMTKLFASLFLVGIVSVAVACSDDPPPPGAVGEACGVSGGGGQCADGAVCGKPSDGTTSLLCLITCKEQTDCPSGQDCNGVEGSAVKGCRPKSGTSDGGTTEGGTDSGKK